MLSDLKEAGNTMQLKRNDYLEVLKEVQSVIPYWEEAAHDAGVADGTADAIASTFRHFSI